MQLIKLLQENITVHQLIEKDELLLLAVSGGADSMALLSALQYLEYNLHVAHVNYHLRGEDSNLDEIVVSDYCKANSIPISIKHAEISSKHGVQQEARKIRYEWFHQLMEEFYVSKVLTAHHQNDQAETVLFNLCRGAGIGGSKGMSMKRDGLIRPFLNIPQSEILSYVKESNVPYRRDASNSSNKYSRNKIRNEVFPLLDELNGAFVKNISEFSSHASQAEMLIIEQANLNWDSKSKRTTTGYVLEVEQMLAWGYRDLMLFYMLAPLEESASVRGEVVKLLDSQTGKRVEGSTYTFWRDRRNLILDKSTIQTEGDFVLKIDSLRKYSLLNKTLLISEEKVTFSKDLGIDFIYLKSTIRLEDLSVRVWKNGDSFQPFGMKGRQKVSDLLIQKKIPVSQKKSTLVLVHKEEVIWVIGLRASEFTSIANKEIKHYKLLITA